MVRQYVQVTDLQRKELVRLIHEEGYSIAKASKVTNIPYDNAKAINRTYLREKRIHKINYRLRYQKKATLRVNNSMEKLEQIIENSNNLSQNGYTHNSSTPLSHEASTDNLPQMNTNLISMVDREGQIKQQPFIYKPNYSNSVKYQPPSSSSNRFAAQLLQSAQQYHQQPQNINATIDNPTMSSQNQQNSNFGSNQLRQLLLQILTQKQSNNQQQHTAPSFAPQQLENLKFTQANFGNSSNTSQNSNVQQQSQLLQNMNSQQSNSQQHPQSAYQQPAQNTQNGNMSNLMMQILMNNQQQNHQNKTRNQYQDLPNSQNSNTDHSKSQKSFQPLIKNLSVVDSNQSSNCSNSSANQSLKFFDFSAYSNQIYDTHTRVTQNHGPSRMVNDCNNRFNLQEIDQNNNRCNSQNHHSVYQQQPNKTIIKIIRPILTTTNTNVAPSTGPDNNPLGGPKNPEPASNYEQLQFQCGMIEKQQLASINRKFSSDNMNSNLVRVKYFKPEIVSQKNSTSSVSTSYSSLHNDDLNCDQNVYPVHHKNSIMAAILSKTKNHSQQQQMMIENIENIHQGYGMQQNKIINAAPAMISQNE
eukprot:403347257